MANLIALRDQENLVTANQTAAAAKPQNQANRQLQPKTPGQKAPKRPFKIPLNDENAFEGAKTGLKSGAKGDENATTAKKGMMGDKNAFVTPMAGPKTRAPLGQKTTNAKAKPFQTPGAPPVENDAGKTKLPSARSRKATPKLAHTEPAKINVLLDTPLEDQEIEYMPPYRAPLPDIPDDIPADVDYSILSDERALIADAFRNYYHDPDTSGLSMAERERQKDARARAREEREMLVRMQRDAAVSAFECWHEPECAGECKDKPEAARKAEETFKVEMAKVEEEFREKPKSAPKDPLEGKKDGPSEDVSKRAAAALSMPHSTPAAGAPSYAKPTQAAAARTAAASVAVRKVPAALHSRGGATVGAVASRSTIGYAKGRSTTASLRDMNDKGRALMAGKPAGPANQAAGTMSARARSGNALGRKGGDVGNSGLSPGSSLAWLARGGNGGGLEEALELDWERENAWLRENAL